MKSPAGISFDVNVDVEITQGTKNKREVFQIWLCKNQTIYVCYATMVDHSGVSSHHKGGWMNRQAPITFSFTGSKIRYPF